MQRRLDFPNREAGEEFALGSAAGRADECGVHRGYFGVQVLIAGRRKPWRDDMQAQVRRAGFGTTTVDSALDALRVLALGVHIDVLLTDVDLHGKVDCCKLAREARAMRPNLAIIFAQEISSNEAELAADDAVILPADARLGGVANLVRNALGARGA